MKHLFTFCLLACFANLHLTALAQKPEHEKTKKRSTIPFQVTAHNSIVTEAILNGTDTLHLMIHTASADVHLTDDAIARLKSFRLNGKVDSVKSWGGSANTAGFSKDNSLDISKISLKNIMIWQDKNSGQGTDGKYGLNLFKDQVLTFDFDKNLLTVQTSLPRNVKGYDKFKLSFKNDMLFIEAVCQAGKDTFTNQFLIHTGFGGAALLDDNFSSRHQMAEKLQITGERKMSDAYGNVFITKKAIMPGFAIGKYLLTNVPVDFFQGAIGRQKMSVVGGDILKRFNWIIDAKREYIYLKPNHLYKIGYLNT